MKHIVGAALAAFALLSCNATQTEAKPLKPALWKVSDADTTIYLFGTIHLLPKELDWQSRKMDRAIRASDSLVLETVLDKNPAETGAVMSRLGMSPGLPPLLDRVPADKRDILKRLVTKSGVSLTVLDRFETWAAALTLASAGMRDLPVSVEHGSEAVLSKRFATDKKAVMGLETPAQQLGFFDALPEAAQREFLASIAEDDSSARAQFEAMIAAWGSGNVKKIAETFDDELKLTPELADALLKKRNVNWSNWITTRMAQPGTVFLAVGAGHLAGSGSVNDLLTKRGLRVSRVQ